MNGFGQQVGNVQSARNYRRELIGRMAVGVAHEIRNPLTVIKGYLQLREKKSAGFKGESLDIIFEELQKIEVLITNIISLAQNKAIKKKPENINDILARIYPAIQCAAAKNGMMTELLLENNLPALNMSSEEIEQMVFHLVWNGIEAMPVGGTLRIGSGYHSGRVSLYVQDEGGGIPFKEQEQIFDPFYSTKPGHKGLGLAICLSIAERHQGEIDVVSNNNAGSIFTILFSNTELL